MGRQLRRVRSLLLLFLVLGSLIKRVTASKKQNVLVLIGQPSGHPPKESPPKESPPKESQPKESPASKSRYDLKDEETSPPAEVVEVSKRVGVEAPKELIAAHRKLFYDGRVVSKDMPVVVMFHKSLNIEELKKWLKSNFGKDVGKDVENKVLSKVEVRGESKLKDWEFDVKKPLKGWKIRKSEVFAAPESKELVVKSGSGELKKKEEPKIGKYIWFVSVEDNVEGKDSSKENAYWRTVILHQLELLARVLGNENEVTFNIVGSDFRIIPGKNGSFSGFGNGEKWSDVKNRFLKSEEDLGVDGAGFILKPVLLMLAHTDESEAAKMREYAKNIAAVPSILCNDPVKVDEESPFAVYRGSKLLIIDFEGTLAVPMRKVIDGGGDVKETLKLYKPGMREVQKAVRDVVFNKAMVSDGMPVIVVADSVESSLEIEYVKMVFGVDEYSCFTDLSDALKSVDPFWRGLSGIKIRRGTKLRGMGQVSHTADGTIPKAVGGSMKGFTEIPKDVFVVSCMHWLQNNFERRLGKSLVIMAVTEVVSRLAVLPTDVHYVGDREDIAGKSVNGVILFGLERKTGSSEVVGSHGVEQLNEGLHKKVEEKIRSYIEEEEREEGEKKEKKKCPLMKIGVFGKGFDWSSAYITRNEKELTLWPMLLSTRKDLYLPSTVKAIDVKSKEVAKRLREVISAYKGVIKEDADFKYYSTRKYIQLFVVDTAGVSGEMQKVISVNGVQAKKEKKRRSERHSVESMVMLIDGSVQGAELKHTGPVIWLDESGLKKVQDSCEKDDLKCSCAVGQGYNEAESFGLVSIEDTLNAIEGGSLKESSDAEKKRFVMLSVVEQLAKYILNLRGNENAELTIIIGSADEKILLGKSDGYIFFGGEEKVMVKEELFIEKPEVSFESVLFTLAGGEDAIGEFAKNLYSMTAVLYNDPVILTAKSAFGVHRGSRILVVNFDPHIYCGGGRHEVGDDDAVKVAMVSLLLNDSLRSDGMPLIVLTEWELGDKEVDYIRRAFGMEKGRADSIEIDRLYAGVDQTNVDPYKGRDEFLSLWMLRPSRDHLNISLNVIIVSSFSTRARKQQHKMWKESLGFIGKMSNYFKEKVEEEEVVRQRKEVSLSAALMRVVEIVARTAVLPTVIHFVGESESGLAGKSSEGEIMFDSKKGVGLGDLLKEFSDKNVEDLYIKRNAEHLTFKSLVLPKTKSGGLKELMKGRASQLKDVSEESFDVRKCDVKSGKFDICKMART
eukprot:GHVS01075309.1.p1 GENE.GHVS01075309.1~~GHVS01075309.1.p1  ORF type:complete len:1237 (+),score=168.13 GHVS01075309.1:52-3762(+)